METQTDTRLQHLLAQLEAGGRRATPQRAAVCAALLAHGGHPTVAEIWLRVQTAHPSISQATVYNSIAALEALGLIRRLDIAGDGHTHYDMDIAPHVNAFCRRCGRVADVHTDTLEALLGLVAARSGYDLDPSEGVIVYGLCAECRRTMNDER